MIQDTSLQAFDREVQNTLGERHREVLRAMNVLGSATNTELADHLQWSINRVTPRVNELVKRNIIMDAGKRTCTKTGRLVHAWTLREKPLDVKKTYTFHSHTNSGVKHQVTDLGTRIYCTCESFRYRKTCRHVEEVSKTKEQVTLFS